MSKRRFQFSMAQLFVATIFLATAIRLLVLLLDIRFERGFGQLPEILYFCIFITGGAGIGCFTDNSIKGALYGAIGGFCLAIVIGGLFFSGVTAARE
jgi:hypothetical protein